MFANLTIQPTQGMLLRSFISLLALGVFLLVLMTQTAYCARIYTWKDADGVVHYSDHPENAKADTIVIKPPAIDAATAQRTRSLIQSQHDAVKKHAVDANRADKAELQVQQDQQECDKAHQRVKFLSEIAPARRLRVEKADGSWHWLSEAERTEQLAQAQETVARRCR